MKLSLTLHGKTYSVESDDAFDGTDVYELSEQFKGLLVNAGFHPSNVDSIFNLDYQWFTDEENEGNMQGHIKDNSRAYEYHEQLEEEKNRKISEFQNNMYKQ
jgi:Tat protein secretion system quality control protein TatD with DNase activity